MVKLRNTGREAVGSMGEVSMLRLPATLRKRAPQCWSRLGSFKCVEVLGGVCFFFVSRSVHRLVVWMSWKRSEILKIEKCRRRRESQSFAELLSLLAIVHKSDCDVPRTSPGALGLVITGCSKSNSGSVFTRTVWHDVGLPYRAVWERRDKPVFFFATLVVRFSLALPTSLRAL